MKEFVKYTFPVRLGDAQFFAKKKEEEPEDDDEEEEEEDDEPVTKPKGKESTPAWAQEIISLLKPQAPSKSKMEVPVPEAPVVEEQEEEEEQPEAPKKKSFLKWLL